MVGEEELSEEELSEDIIFLESPFVVFFAENGAPDCEEGEDILVGLFSQVEQISLWWREGVLQEVIGVGLSCLAMFDAFGFDFQLVFVAQELSTVSCFPLLF